MQVFLLCRKKPLTVHPVNAVVGAEQCPSFAAVQSDGIDGFLSFVAPHDPSIDRVVRHSRRAGTSNYQVGAVVASVAWQHADNSRKTIGNEQKVTWFCEIKNVLNVLLQFIFA